MKKLLLLLILALGGISLQAQQRSAGQWALEASGGIVTGKHIGGYGEIGFEKLFKSTASSLHVSFMFRGQKFNTEIDRSVGIQNYDLFALYGYEPLKSKTLPIVWQVLGGMYIGGESIPSSVIKDVYTVDESGFRYGVAIGTQVEFIITEMFNLYVKPMGIYTINSDVEKFAFVPGVGVKLYF